MMNNFVKHSYRSIIRLAILGFVSFYMANFDRASLAFVLEQEQPKVIILDTCTTPIVPETDLQLYILENYRFENRSGCSVTLIRRDEKKVFKRHRAVAAKNYSLPKNNSASASMIPLAEKTKELKETTTPEKENVASAETTPRISATPTTQKTEKTLKFEDKLVGSTFKLLAKTFIAVVNIEKLKKFNLKKINKMDAEKFKSKYAKTYPFLKELPEDIKVRYGVTENMSKEQAVKNTMAMNKKEMYAIVDAIPDKVIYNSFIRYLEERKRDIQEQDIIKEIKHMWNEIQKKAFKKSHKID